MGLSCDVFSTLINNSFLSLVRYLFISCKAHKLFLSLAFLLRHKFESNFSAWSVKLLLSLWKESFRYVRKILFFQSSFEKKENLLNLSGSHKLLMKYSHPHVMRRKEGSFSREQWKSYIAKVSRKKFVFDYLNDDVWQNFNVE